MANPKLEVGSYDRSLDTLLPIMSKISPSFCGAKWFEGTIWLYMQQTASCHHNAHHNIGALDSNPDSIHNTPRKIAEREEMLVGIKSPECNVCWQTEAAGGVSDRMLKTTYIVDHIPILSKWAMNKDAIPRRVVPQNLEIAFSRACNLACSYCSPVFSSTWEADVIKNGSYGLLTDTRFNEKADGVFPGKENPSMRAFWEWWPELSTQLRHLKLTGGEPLMSSEFWSLLDLLSGDTAFTGSLSINTNLTQPIEKIDKMLTKLSKFEFTVSTSIESSLRDAEYSRDGFDSNVWLTNINYILQHSNAGIRISTTINNLTVWTIAALLDLIIDLKRKYGNSRILISSNFVFSPEFMQIQLISPDCRFNLSQSLLSYVALPEFDEHEKLQLQRIIAMLSSEHNFESNYKSLLINDLRSFLKEFDARRNKNFRVELSKQFVDWYDSL